MRNCNLDLDTHELEPVSHFRIFHNTVKLKSLKTSEGNNSKLNFLPQQQLITRTPQLFSPAQESVLFTAEDDLA